MQALFFTISVSLVISLMSLVGSLIVLSTAHSYKNILLHIVSLAAGTLIGNAFLHLIPESAESLPVETVTLTALVAFIIFLLIEKVLQWHHHHEYEHDEHTFGYMSLFGDLVHNFLDGLILLASFQHSISLGLATSVAIVLHEIPQEIGDFGVLIHSGFSKSKAIFSNLVVSFSALLGAFLGFFWMEHTSNLTPYITAFAAGGFLYTGAADLLPEIKQKAKNSNSLVTFLMFVLGIVFIFIAN